METYLNAFEPIVLPYNVDTFDMTGLPIEHVAASVKEKRNGPVAKRKQRSDEMDDGMISFEKPSKQSRRGIPVPRKQFFVGQMTLTQTNRSGRTRFKIVTRSIHETDPVAFPTVAAKIYVAGLEERGLEDQIGNEYVLAVYNPSKRTIYVYAVSVVERAPNEFIPYVHATVETGSPVFTATRQSQEDYWHFKYTPNVG